MRPADRSGPNPIQKKAAQSAKQEGCAKVWVNPKSTVKNRCEQAWSQAEAPSPKFIDMDQIDLRTRKPRERAKPQTAASSKARASPKSPTV